MTHDFPSWTWGFYIVPVLFLLLAGVFIARRPWWSRLPHEDDAFSNHSPYRQPFVGGIYYPNISPGPLPKRASARGPKNYRRSDERIAEDINDRLSMGFVDAFNIEAHCANRHVTLSGHVENREEKRAVEAMVDSVPGVSDVTNALTIMKLKNTGERAA